MKLQRLALAAAGIGLLTAAVAPVPAVASGQVEPKPSVKSALAKKKLAPAGILTAGAPCELWIGAPNTSAQVPTAVVKPRKPPYAPSVEDTGTIGFFNTRANASWYIATNASQTQTFFHGLFLGGDMLYRHYVYLNDDGSTVPTASRIGSGWSGFRSIATSNYSIAQPRHSYLYGLHTNGSLYRYASSGAGFRSHGSFPGFRGFKAMTVISETATYDTLLMNTNAGALYTIRIPVAAGAKPVVKQVRKSGWLDYESLVAYSCGNYRGAVVAGIDHNTQTGNLFAMSKANGLSTVITAYGRIPATFGGVSHVSLTGHYDQMTSE